MRKSSVRRALAAAIAGTFGTALVASAGSIYTESNLSAPGASPHFVALVDADLHRPPMVMFSWGKSVPAGPAQGAFDLPVSDPFDSYAVFGRDSSGGVFVTFADAAAGKGTSFETMFPGISETDLAAALSSGTDTQVVTDFAALIAKTPAAITPMGATSSVTHFSDGADYGTFQASFTPLPEPGSCMLIVGAAGGGLLFRRRSGATPSDAQVP